MSDVLTLLVNYKLILQREGSVVYSVLFLTVLQIWKGGTDSTGKLSVQFCRTRNPDKFFRRVLKLCSLSQNFHVVHVLERLLQNCEIVLIELFFKGKEKKVEGEKRRNDF